MSDPIQPDPAAGTPQASDGTIVTPPTEPSKDVKPAETKPEEKPAGSQPERKVPESYELKLPKDSLLDQARLNEVAEYAKAKKLTNEEAQDIIERESGLISAYVDSQKKQQEEVWNKQKEQWVSEWKNDKEIGGSEFEKNAELAKRVVERFGDDQFKKDLNESGFGNHPGLGRLLVKLGKAMSEDTLKMPGSAPAGIERKSTAEVFYPTKKE